MSERCSQGSGALSCLGEGSRQLASHFHSILLKVTLKMGRVSGNSIKPRKKKNTFCVISEPHLLAVITKAYVSGFHIHITSSGLYIHTHTHTHTRESSKAKRRLTGDNVIGRGRSVHIYNVQKRDGGERGKTCENSSSQARQRKQTVAESCVCPPKRFSLK